MDQGYPFRRNRAKAIAISTRLEQQRRAVFARVSMVVVSMVVVIEAAIVAHRLWAASQP